MKDIEILRMFRDIEEKQKKLKNKYGDIKPIIHIEHLGYHFVAIGNKHLYSNKWNTFVDFLIDYIWHLFGKEWIDQEKAKKETERHVLLKWWNSILKFQKTQEKNADGLYYSKPSGPLKAFITLAYDLYLLAHHMKLQNRIIDRLKNSDQFQGARYELFVASTLIRAGFELLYEDETDRRKKHFEFTAKHKKSGELVAIEAKSKHRPGVLGYSGKRETNNEIRVRVGGLINSAISKKPNLPYILFIDLNLPPQKIAIFDDPELRELSKTLINTKNTYDDKDYFNLILYTNFPYHYGHELEDSPEDHLSSTISLKPLYPLRTDSIIQDIQVAIKKYGKIPNDFSEFRKN